MDNLFKNYFQLVFIANECVNEHMVLPALVLIYTAIDSASWLASDNPSEDVGSRFKNWVNTWMLSNGKLECSAEELYAARCGVLHTLTPNSTLTEKKGVRKIAYAWGNAKQEALEESISALSMSNNIASIHLEDLFWCFRNGFADYLEHTLSNDKEKERFLSKSNQHFASIEMEKVDEFLNSTRNIAKNMASS